MKKNIKKIVAVVSAFAMAVSGVTISPVKTQAAGAYSTNGDWANLVAGGGVVAGENQNHYQVEGISAVYAGHWGNDSADIDFTPDSEDPYTWQVDVDRVGGTPAWLMQLALNVQNLDSTKVYTVTVTSDDTVIYTTAVNSATEFKSIIDVTPTLAQGSHTVHLAATEMVPGDEEPDVETITIIPRTGDIAAQYNIWADWTNPEGTAKAYAYLNEVDNDHSAALAGNAWIFNDQANQPMKSVDKVGQTRDASVVVEMGGTYTLIVEAFNAFNQKIGYGELEITIPSPEQIGGDVVFTNSYRQDCEVGGVTYYALYANWESVPGAAGYKSYINSETAGNEAKASNGHIWSDQGTVGSGDTHIDTVYSSKNGEILIADDQEYTVIVVAYDSKGTEIGRGTVNFPAREGSGGQTSSSEGSSQAGAVVPNAPVGLVVNANKETGLVTIAFQNVEGAESYNLYIDDDKVGAITNGGTIAYNSLVAGSHYAQVTAVNAAGESELSAKANFSIEGDTTSESESQPSGGEYDGLTWTQVGDTDYYVAAVHGNVKNAFPFQLLEDQSNQMLIIPGVAAGDKPIWPDFSDATLNGAEFAQAPGAGIYISYALLNDNSYNVYEATSAVANDRFQIIIKAGNPTSGETGDVVTSDLVIDGYQANVSGITVNNKTYEGGIRVVYSKPDTVEGKDISDATEFGLLFGNGEIAAEDMVISVPNTNIKKVVATSAGLADGKYAVTMATNFTTASVASLSRTFTVRSFAVIDGVTYYSDTTTFTEISILKAVYESGTLTGEQATKYLKVIKKVDPDYVG